jgi:hypothetical protein
MPSKKQWWGSQETFTTTDKYHRKKTIKWGKPLIYLCNPEDDPFRTQEWNGWYDDNCIRLVLTKKMFEINPPAHGA